MIVEGFSTLATTEFHNQGVRGAGCGVRSI